jgi:hypothetical protein
MLVHLEAARRAPSTTVAAAIIRAYRLPPGDATALMDAAVGGVGRDYTPWGTPAGRWDVVHGAACEIVLAEERNWLSLETKETS